MKSTMYSRERRYENPSTERTLYDKKRASDVREIAKKIIRYFSCYHYAIDFLLKTGIPMKKLLQPRSLDFFKTLTGSEQSNRYDSAKSLLTNKETFDKLRPFLREDVAEAMEFLHQNNGIGIATSENILALECLHRLSENPDLFETVSNGLELVVNESTMITFRRATKDMPYRDRPLQHTLMPIDFARCDDMLQSHMEHLGIIPSQGQRYPPGIQLSII